MSSSVIDSWLDRLSQAEEEQHLSTPVSRKRKTEETLKRQLKRKADEDLENYQALEPSLFRPSSARSETSAKKRKTDDGTASYGPQSGTTSLSTRESSRGDQSSSKSSQYPTQRDLLFAIPAITSTSPLHQVSPRGLALLRYLTRVSEPPYLPDSLKVSTHPSIFISVPELTCATEDQPEPSRSQATPNFRMYVGRAWKTAHFQSQCRQTPDHI